MEIATGYFAKARDYYADGWVLVSISLKDPWFVPDDIPMSALKELAPTQEILSLKDNPSEYARKYEEDVLPKLDWCELYNKLSTLADSAKRSKVALLCYEAPGKFCHRHIVADWLSKKTGTQIKEINLINKPSKNDLFDSDSFSF